MGWGIKLRTSENVKNNLRFEMMEAFKANDFKKICDVAQKIFDQGFELEDMGLLPSVFNVVCSVLIQMKWTPKTGDL